MLGFARWFFATVGGVLIGMGLVLHGQVALAHMLRDQVDRTFFLWRAIGEATIFLQSDDVRMALAMSEVPAEVLKESDLAAWTLVAVGALLACTAPLLRPEPAAAPAPAAGLRRAGATGTKAAAKAGPKAPARKTATRVSP
jgi:hypothetical protein